MAYFPLFIQLNQVPCLVVGGGKIALRKIRVLLDFDAKVTVVASSFVDEIRQIKKGVICHQKAYESSDLPGHTLVIAATDDGALNHKISRDCRELGIWVNVADKQEECDFILPAYQKAGDVVAAFSSGGNSPVLTQYLKEKNEKFVSGELGEMNAFLGKIRHQVKETVAQESLRRQFYRELLQYWETRGEIPSDERVEILFDRYREKEKGKDRDGTYKAIKNE